MVIEEESVEHIANLAKLDLTKDQKSLYAKQLSEVLNYVQQLEEVDTQGVEPMVTPSPIAKEYREDRVQEPPSIAEKLQNAPDKSGNLVKVPPVVG